MRKCWRLQCRIEEEVGQVVCHHSAYRSSGSGMKELTNEYISTRSWIPAEEKGRRSREIEGSE